LNKEKERLEVTSTALQRTLASVKDFCSIAELSFYNKLFIGFKLSPLI
jgi:hypothetical protein